MEEFFCLGSYLSNPGSLNMTLKTENHTEGNLCPAWGPRVPIVLSQSGCHSSWWVRFMIGCLWHVSCFFELTADLGFNAYYSFFLNNFPCIQERKMKGSILTVLSFYLPPLGLGIFRCNRRLIIVHMSWIVVERFII